MAGTHFSVLQVVVYELVDLGEALGVEASQAAGLDDVRRAVESCRAGRLVVGGAWLLASYTCGHYAIPVVADRRSVAVQ